MIQILFGIWTCTLKQSCIVFCREHFFFLPQILKNFAKASKFTFKLFWGKRNSKKGKRGRRCWADLPPLRPARTSGPALPLLPARGRVLPFYTWCRSRGGRTPATWPRPPDTTTLLQVPPFSLSSPRSPSATPAPSFAMAPLLAELCRSPPAVSAGRSPRQVHHRVRNHRGKPLRTLNWGGKPPCDCNGSPEFTRPHQSAPPRWNLPFSALFRLFLCALCSGWPERAPTVLRRRSTPPEWPSHGEQHHRAAMHANEGALAVPRPSQGHHWVCLAAGNTLVLTPGRDLLVGGAPPLRHADQWG